MKNDPTSDLVSDPARQDIINTHHILKPGSQGPCEWVQRFKNICNVREARMLSSSLEYLFHSMQHHRAYVHFAEVGGSEVKWLNLQQGLNSNSQLSNAISTQILPIARS